MHIFILLITALALGACQRTEEPMTYELAFKQYEFEIQEGTRYMIAVAAGNGRYEVSVDDPTVLDARAQRQYRGFGEIVVTANKTGRTSLRVRDKKTGGEALLKFTVFRPHMELTLGHVATAISGIEEEETRRELEQKMVSRQTLHQGYKYVLVKNENRTLYVFGPPEGPGYGELLYTGTYRLYGKEKDVYCISLDCDGGPKEFYMSNGYTASVFDYLFSPEWNLTRSPVIDTWVELTENVTGLLAADYPGLERAHLAYQLHFRLSIGGSLLPVDMVTI